MWAEKLKNILAEIEREPDRARLNDLWRSAGTTLQRTAVDKMKAARTVAMRDLGTLRMLVAEVEKNPQLAVQTRYTPSSPARPAPAPPPAPAEEPVAISAATATALAEPPTEADLVAALKAFRKRLKVTQLDEQSKITSRQLTTGKRASVVAITAPNQFPRAVWEALVEKGKLRGSGGGLYELADN
ncbi:MAG: hypothetical protein AB7K52_11500 [Phycisphaerales bacterium]